MRITVAPLQLNPALKQWRQLEPGHVVENNLGEKFYVFSTARVLQLSHTDQISTLGYAEAKDMMFRDLGPHTLHIDP